jgi:hypothetical protein
MKIAQNFISIRIYVTEKSIYIQKYDSRIKLIGLYYIIDTKILFFLKLTLLLTLNKNLSYIANKIIQSNFNGNLV